MMSLLAWIYQRDTGVLLALNQMRNQVFDCVMPMFSSADVAYTVFALILVWRLWKGNNRERILWVGLVFAVALGDILATKVLKPLVGRPRPFLSVDGLYLFRKGEWIITDPEVREHLRVSFGWPSNHALNSWTVAVYLAFLAPRWAPILLFTALSVAFSRVYLGVHYPLDVVGGASLGALWGWLCMIMARWLAARAPGCTVPLARGIPDSQAVQGNPKG